MSLKEWIGIVGIESSLALLRANLHHTDARGVEKVDLAEAAKGAERTYHCRLDRRNAGWAHRRSHQRHSKYPTGT